LKRSIEAISRRSKGLALLLPFGVDIDDFSTGFYTHATPLASSGSAKTRQA
jgi:hypothetical protein